MSAASTGPWIAVKRITKNCQSFDIIDTNGELVEWVCFDGPISEKQTANAKLAAMAPELLEVAQRLRDKLESFSYSDEDMEAKHFDLLVDSLTVINKANGEEV